MHNWRPFDEESINTGLSGHILRPQSAKFTALMFPYVVWRLSDCLPNGPTCSVGEIISHGHRGNLDIDLGTYTIKLWISFHACIGRCIQFSEQCKRREVWISPLDTLNVRWLAYRISPYPVDSMNMLTESQLQKFLLTQLKLVMHKWLTRTEHKRFESPLPYLPTSKSPHWPHAQPGQRN